MTFLCSNAGPQALAPESRPEGPDNHHAQQIPQAMLVHAGVWDPGSQSWGRTAHLAKQIASSPVKGSCVLQLKRWLSFQGRLRGGIQKAKDFISTNQKICHREHFWYIWESLLKSFMDSCQFWRKENTRPKSVILKPHHKPTVKPGPGSDVNHFSFEVADLQLPFHCFRWF